MNQRIEFLTEKILAEAAKEAEEIRCAAAREAEAIRREAEEKSRSVLADAGKKAALMAERAAERGAAAARNARRNRLLAQKGALVSQAFDRALTRILTLPPDAYLAFLTRLLRRALKDLQDTEDTFAAYGEEDFVPAMALTLVMAERDASLGEALIASVREELSFAGKTLTVGPCDKKLSAGFLLVAGDRITDCTPSSLMQSAEGRMAGEISACLFG